MKVTTASRLQNYVNLFCQYDYVCYEWAQLLLSRNDIVDGVPNCGTIIIEKLYVGQNEKQK